MLRAPRPLNPAAICAASFVFGACASGPPSPPVLAYGDERVEEVVYTYTDTTEIDVSVMGQSMQLSQRGEAEYDVAFQPGSTGVDVTLSVRSLSSTLSQPLGAPVRTDESMVSGELAFALDRVGDATVARRPEVADELSLMVSGLSLANTLFPGLPGTPALPGETWVDSLSYSGEEGSGQLSESSVLTYTVVGDTLVDDRSLLHVTVAGTTTVFNELSISGMQVSQTSELDVSGYILWDHQAGILFESYREEAGSGTVSVPIAPAPLPIRVRTVQRTRVQTP